MGARGTVIVAGGGGAEDSRAVDRLLVDLIGPSAKILYLPTAMDGRARSYASSLAWLTSTLHPLGRTDITMWTDLAGKARDDLAHFAAVYIGGGNTYRLLHELRRHHVDRALTSYLAEGGVIYGGSAGAIVLGRDIATCAHQDTNLVGLVDTGGLNLTHGHSIWCHYAPDDDPLIIEYVRERRHPVLALSERAGASITRGAIHPVGPEPIIVFTEAGKHRL